MGNRAIITTEDRGLGLYLHHNGGRDSVEAFLRYCKLKGYRSPDVDCYGWARLCQVIGNFFGGGLSVGITPYTTDAQINPGDNGIYIIKGWEIVGRVYPYKEFTDRDEQRVYDIDEMVEYIDSKQPADEQLGGYLSAARKQRDDLEVGDLVYMRDLNGKPRLRKVVGFRDGVPYVDIYDTPDGYESNPNNYIKTSEVKVPQ